MAALCLLYDLMSSNSSLSCWCLLCNRATCSEKATFTS
uniref:Uncharacterized protein n=1 Tax=Anguilla anguilla TaxID=7936 RepID=A0A0E9VG37_ANGAN